MVPHLPQYAAVERLERAIESIQSTIEEQGGALIVKMKVCLLFFFPRTNNILKNALETTRKRPVKS